jgi:membrane protease YdiL (CAAX protease family)
MAPPVPTGDDAPVIDPTPSARPARGPGPVAVALLTVGASLAWILIVGMVAGGVVTARLMGDGVPADQLSAALQRAFTQPGAMVATTAVQFAGFAAILRLAVGMLGTAALAWGPMTKRGWAGAALVGLSIGSVAGGLAEVLKGKLGFDSTHLDAVARTIAEAPWPIAACFGLLVVLVAPAIEEVLFRGVLWRGAERLGGPFGAWIGTSLLFAAYHLNALHALSLLPTALLLGWLRMRTGSLKAPLLAHYLNNALAWGATVALGGSAEAPASPVVPVLAAAVSLVGVMVVIGEKDRADRW